MLLYLPAIDWVRWPEICLYALVHLCWCSFSCEFFDAEFTLLVLLESRQRVNRIGCWQQESLDANREIHLPPPWLGVMIVREQMVVFSFKEVVSCEWKI